MNKESGGLGVRKIREFNLTLLGKWCWRLQEERERLWYIVLMARYGEVGDRIEDGGRLTSVWWRNLVSISEGVGLGVGNWFDDNLQCCVSNRVSTLFWWDPWLEGDVVIHRFGRLYDLSENKMVTVADMSNLGWSVHGDGGKWQRHLLAWEEVVARSSLFTNIVLQDDVEDKWHWNLHSSQNYTVNNAYHLLSADNINHPFIPVDLTLHKAVPLKICLFACRLLQNRLPTIDNLIRRGALHNNNQFCWGGCGSTENADHLFMNCDFYGSIWPMVTLWLGFDSVFPAHITKHSLQFCHLGGSSKKYRLLLHLI